MSTRASTAAVPTGAAATTVARARPDRKQVYLHPGALVASFDPCTVTTILGSCVSVCLFDVRRGAGGANHYLLPHRVGGAGQASPRYGNAALAQLLAQLAALGCRKVDLRAKVFGGACVIDAFAATADHVGARNARTALQMLEAERIPVVEDDLGGARGRRLVFNTDDGSTSVSLI